MRSYMRSYENIWVKPCNLLYNYSLAGEVHFISSHLAFACLEHVSLPLRRKLYKCLCEGEIIIFNAADFVLVQKQNWIVKWRAVVYESFEEVKLLVATLFFITWRSKTTVKIRRWKSNASVFNFLTVYLFTAGKEEMFEEWREKMCVRRCE